MRQASSFRFGSSPAPRTGAVWLLTALQLSSCSDDAPAPGPGVDGGADAAASSSEQSSSASGDDRSTASPDPGSSSNAVTYSIQTSGGGDTVDAGLETSAYSESSSETTESYATNSEPTTLEVLDAGLSFETTSYGSGGGSTGSSSVSGDASTDPDASTSEEPMDTSGTDETSAPLQTTEATSDTSSGTRGDAGTTCAPLTSPLIDPVRTTITTEEECFPSCITELYALCSAGERCNRASENGRATACWDNGMKLHRSQASDGAAIITTSHAVVADQDCYTVQAKFYLTGGAAEWTWFNNCGTPVATGTKVSGQVYTVSCLDRDETRVVDMGAEACTPYVDGAPRTSACVVTPGCPD